MAGSQPDEKVMHALLGAVGLNMDRLRHGIDALRQIHNHWRGNNGTSINLIAQLSALKSKLGQIHDWLNYAMSEMHPQLLSDLTVLMSSCGLLVGHMDALIDRLQQPNHDAYDCAIRMKYSMGGRSMERLRKVAIEQTDALALLLAACKCHATAQRKILLHKSRQIRSRDGKSLKMLQGSSRVNGACIRVLTQTSAVIQCSRYIFYVKLLRREPEHIPTEEEYDVAAAVIRSDAIDRALQEDASSLRHEIKLVAAGNSTSGKELVVHQMKALYAESYHSTEELKTYRKAVRSTVRVLLHAMIDLLKDTGIILPTDLNQEFAILLHEVETIDPQTITKDGVQAVERIWSCQEFATLYTQNFEIGFPSCAPYFVREIRRIASDDYVPSEADISRLIQHSRGVKEARFKWNELDVHLFNMNGYKSDNFRRRWYHQLEGATALIYTVDISEYDRPYLGQSSQSHLVYEFGAFTSWATQEEFADSSVILILNNFSRFCDKLEHAPLDSFFDDFVPDEKDVAESSRQYLLSRFKKANFNGLSIYSFWVDLELGDNAALFDSIKNTLQHIQQRKARDQVWNASQVSGSDSRSGTGLVSRLLPSRSGTFSRTTVETDGSRVISPVRSEKAG